MKKLLLCLLLLSQSLVAQKVLKNVERQDGNSTDLQRRLNAEEVDNEMFRKGQQKSLYYNKINDPENLNEITAQKEGVKIVKDADTGLPIFIEGKPQRLIPSLRQARSSAEAAAFAYLKTFRNILKIKDAETAFDISNTETEADGQTHFRMQQFYMGVPVYGGELVLHTDANGDVNTLNGRYFPTPKIESISPQVSADESFTLAIKELEKTTLVRPLSFGQKKFLNITDTKPTLVVYHPKQNSDDERLAWYIETHANVIEHWAVFVDAQTGQILHKQNRTCTIDGPAKATASDLNGIARTIDTYQLGTRFYLIDVTRTTPTGAAMFKPSLSQMPDNPVGGIITVNAQNSKVSDQDLNLAHVVSSTNAWNLPSAVSAHYNAATAFEYFKRVHKRNSIDGKGGTIMSIINMADEDGGGFDNAFWSDKIMVYGNGRTAFKPLAGGLDVAAHEMTHGVVQNSANLEYESQSGAINESMADVFGAMVDRDDWRMGEDVVRTSAFPSGALRDLGNPNNGGTRLGRGWQPKGMGEYYAGDEDNGGVHINSGIVNFAFYKYATAITKDKAELVYYRTLTKYLTRFSKFIDLRLGVIKAATELYGASSAEVTAARTAFDAVGILDNTSSGTPTPTPTPTTIPPNPGQDYLLWYFPGSNGTQRIRRAPIANNTVGTVTNLYNPPIRHKVSISDDGRFGYYVSTDDALIKAITLNPAETFSETVVSNEPVWENVAISRDGNKLAAISKNKDKNIWVYSYDKKIWKKFVLYNPTYTQGVQTGQVKYTDSFEWDPTGEFLVYDAYNELSVSGFANGSSTSAVGYWDIGFLKVWDNSKKDFGSGEVQKLISNLERGESIGNPTFAKNDPNILAFDYLDAENNYYIIGTNLETGELSGILQNNTISYPEYSRLDNRIIFNTQTGTAKRDDIGVIALATDKISAPANAQATLMVSNAKWGSWYTVGSRDLPQKNQQTITQPTVAEKFTNDPPFALNVSATSKLPVGLSLVSGPAELSGNNVSITGEGDIRITAYQEGNTQFYAAPRITISIKVSAKAIVLSSEPTLENQILAFPNPMGNILNLKVPQNLKIESVQMTDINGATLFEENGTRKQEQSLDVNGLSKGSYLIKIQTNEGTATKKVVKE
jgi:bacillolysin